MQGPFKLILSGRTKRSPLPHATENTTWNSKLVTRCQLHETARKFTKAIIIILDSCREEASLMRSSSPCKQCCTEGGGPEMHEGVQRTRKVW